MYYKFYRLKLSLKLLLIPLTMLFSLNELLCPSINLFTSTFHDLERVGMLSAAIGSKNSMIMSLKDVDLLFLFCYEVQYLKFKFSDSVAGNAIYQV